ncbi:MAG: acetyl-CoA carboxylase biotin carboxyl carrier protein subunit, partial [Bacteroidota bacterium]
KRGHIRDLFRNIVQKIIAMYKVQVNQNEAMEIDPGEISNGEVKVDGKIHQADVHPIDHRRISILLERKSFVAELTDYNETMKEMTIKINNHPYQVRLQDKLDLMLKSLGMDAGQSSKVNELKAPMPGLVLEVRVKVGDTVKKGDPLLVLEAMKMENILKSPADGIIQKVHVQKSAAVEKNQTLINFA